MTKVAILPGHEYDLVSPEELAAHTQKITHLFEEQQRAALRGIKAIRIQPLYMNVAGGNFQGILNGPRAGFAWVVRRISVYGIAATDVSGAVINMFMGDSARAAFFIDSIRANTAWIGSSECLILNGLDNLFIIGSGAATSTQIVASGSVIETPAEMVGKLL